MSRFLKKGTDSRMFKFLTPDLATIYDGQRFYYTAPRPGEKWGTPTMHPNPAEPDGQACGPGRLHAMLRLDARYAPSFWWPWWCRGVGREIGRDEEKASFAGLQLRRIEPRAFWKMIRWGWAKGANLSGANLSGADLRGANLRTIICNHTIAPAGFVWPETVVMVRD